MNKSLLQCSLHSLRRAAHRITLMLAAGICAYVYAPASGAQPAYPSKPIRLIIPFTAGGASDVVARIVTQRMSESLGQNIFIDNRGGAAGNIGTEIAAKSPPDGYTIAFGNVSTHAINAAIYKLPFSPERDFAPVTVVAVLTNILVVHPTLPVHSVKDLIGLAKARAGQVDYASAGSGSPAHLAGEMFNSMAKVKLNHIPFRGGALATNDLVAGHVAIMFNAMPAAMPHVQTNRLRAIAVTTAKRSRGAPQVPTIAEAGIPGYDLSSWNGFLLPAGTPREIVTRLRDESVKALQIADVNKRLVSIGADPVGNTPEEFVAIIRTDLVRMAKLVKESGAKAD
ncbi:MAG: tripartite tricarboxylate transporter substrate binding protein [Burkholderiales bacterium]